MAIIIGTSGNDLLFTRNRGDILLGMAGNDTLIALHGFNILLGGYGDDQLTALSSFNILSGGAGNDYLQADRGSNVLSGGDGDDTLLSSADRNVLSGDAGNDYLVALAGTGNVLNGGDGNDLLEAYSGTNLLNGGAGNDTLYSLGSGNIVNGGDGDDALTAFSNGNVLNGDAGNDVLIVAGGSGNTLSGGGGDDSIQISGSGNTAKGNGGNDQLLVFDGSGNVLSGGDGMDFLSTQSDGNTLNGDAGNDSLVVSGSGNILNGGDDDDFFNSGFDVNNNILNGDAGNDFLQIWSGVGNVLNGGVGNDQLISFGSNVLNGGVGNDTVVANDGSNILNGDEGDDTLAAAGSSVGNLIDGGDGNDQVQAFTDSNILNGGGGNDFLGVFAGAGNIVNGGDGLDLLIAFANNNILNGDAGNDVVAVNGGNGNILSGGDGDDNLGAVSSIGNILNGDGGNDQLDVDGGSGNLFNGGDGDDLFRLFFSASNVFNGNTGNDSFVSIAFAGSTGTTISGGEGEDSVQLSGSGNFANGDAGDDNLAVVGGTGNLLDGGDGNDTLSSGEGDDTLLGQAGNDTIRGGAGEDILVGGAGFDTLSYDDSPTRVIVNLFNTSTITVGGIPVGPGQAFDGFGTFDTVSGFESVIGSDFNDWIQGSTNVANLLIGGAGNDTLVGSGMSDGINPLVPGAANDTLLGGAGNDVLRQSRGSDIIDGGEGFDQLEFVGNGIPYGGGIGVSVNLAMGLSDADPSDTDTVHGVGGDVATVSSIELVVGTSGNDVFTGGDPLHAPGIEGGQTEFFRPLGGNDTITGMAGRGWNTGVDYSTNSSVHPVSVVLGNSDNLGTALDGFGFIDTLIDVDIARGGAGNDSLVGGSYSQGNSGLFLEIFRGNAGNDTIDGQGSDAVIGAFGVTNRAEFNNSPGSVIVNLGPTPIVVGLDTVAGGTARDGFGTTDTLIAINHVRGSNSFLGDLLVGGNPAFDFLERFTGDAGNDTLVGGSGNDEADYFSSPAGVVVNLGLATASDGFGGVDTLDSIEWARGGDFNDTLIGGANELERLTGGIGNDSIDGGSMTGVNYASFILGRTGANAFVANGVGTAFDDGQGGTDTLVNINGLWGSNFNDTLTGGLGDQWFVGGGGSDVIDGGEGADTVSYMADPNGVTVNLATGSASDGWGGIWGLQGTDTLTSIENVEGSSFNDSIAGDANANRLEGGAGNDTIKGGAGDDTLAGGAGIDTLLYDDSPTRVIVNMFMTTTVNVGGEMVAPGNARDGFGSTDTISGFETVIGSAFNDYMQGTSNIAHRLEGGASNDTLAGSGGNDGINPPVPGAANDTLLGGLGDDVLRQTRGNDSIVGGDGFDRLEFVGNGIAYGGGIGVSVDLALGTSNADPNNGDAVHGPGGDVATVSGIEHVLGTVGNDNLIGDANANLLEGGAGDDTLQGGAGNDTIDGGASGAGGDRMSFSNATTGINFTLVQSSSDTVVDLTAVGLGIDTYRNIEVVIGTSFDDTLTGSSADDRLQGGPGNDIIDGGAGTNDRILFLDATGAIDFTLVQSPLDTMVDLSGVGLGTDTYRNIEGVVGTNFNDTLTGSSGNDFITGAGGNDSISGVDGNDTLRGSGGNDTIDGGDGIDSLEFANAGAGINFTLNQGTNPGDPENGLWSTGFLPGGIGTDFYKNMEGVIGTNFNDTLTGSAGADVIDGGAGNNDTLRGGAGNDTIDGGAGSNDSIVFSDATGAINFTLNQGTNPGDPNGLWSTGALPGIGTDFYKNIEGVVGTGFSDTLTGSSLDDRLQGGAGDDTIDGGAGSNDRIAFSDATGAINFTLNQGTNPGDPNGLWSTGALPGIGTDFYKNIEGVVGSSFNDTLTGSSGNDLVIGAGGNDSLHGAEGDDTLRGSGGNDTIDGSSGIDRIDFANATGAVNFTLNQGTNPGDPVNGLWSTGALAGVGTDFYKNIEGVVGSDFNDTLTGSSLADVLEGGGGTDLMTGGAGIDTFEFNATSDSSAALSFSDVITDFLHGTDKIDLSAIDANTGLDGNQDFLFGGNDASTVANRVSWSEDVANTRTIVHIDTNGDTEADMQIVLQGVGLGLTDADFIL